MNSQSLQQGSVIVWSRRQEAFVCVLCGSDNTFISRLEAKIKCLNCGAERPYYDQ